MSAGEKWKRKRAYLFRQQGGLCYWCGEAMIEDGYTPIPGRSSPLRQATIDHLDDRFSQERGTHAGTWRTVAACWECNNRRGQERQAAQPIEDLRWRARRFGSGAGTG